MSTLILQVNIKQWDKSQRSPQDVAERAALPNRFIINSEPSFFILKKPCIIDLHLQAQPRSLTKAMLNDGSVQLERFVISQQGDQMLLMYQIDKQTLHTLGNIKNGWIQAKYQWRYAVEEQDKIYWQYEEVTLNAVCAQNYDKDYFLVNEPLLEYCAPE